jgi:hypothetical protein
MITIDNFDITVHNLYAIRTQMIEETRRTLRLDQAASIPPQTLVFTDKAPKLTELDILLGITQELAPYAYFKQPEGFEMGLRRSPFSFSRIAPSFGPREGHSAQEGALLAIVTDSKEEKEEQKDILRLLNTLETLNDWKGYIVGRMAQFLQG